MIRINLLKPEKKEVKETAPVPSQEFKVKKKPAISRLIFLLLVIVCVVLFFSQKNVINKEKSLLKTAQEEKTKLQDVLSKLEQIDLQKSLLEKKINLINQLKSQQEIAVKIMDELSKNLPEWVWLTEASYDSQKIQLKGKALSNNLIADYIFNLENSAVFDNVNLIASTQKKTKEDQFLEFSLNARYVSSIEIPSSEKVPAGSTKIVKKEKK
jgi:Tfp pilus assembly protein PilN